MGKSSPPAPDYQGAANATAQGNRDTLEQQTWANRPNINTPFGQQTWSVTPQWDATTGQYLNTWTQNTNLTPEAQSALDSQMRVQQGRSDLAENMLGDVSGQIGQPMDWSNFQSMAQTPGVPTYTPENIQRGLDTSGLQQVNQIDSSGMQQVNPADRYYNQAGDAIFNQWSSRNEPQFTKDTDALRTQLYNQGLKEGDAAYDDEMRKLRESQTDARNQASYNATIGAGQEAQRMYGMDLGNRQQQFGEANQNFANQLGLRSQQFGETATGGNFANAAASQALQQQLGIGNQQFGQNMQAAGYQNQLRQQQIAEEMQRRGFSLNEMNALLSGQQVGMPNMPDFTNAGRSQGPDMLNAAGLQGQSQLDQYNAQQQQLGSALSGIAMMFSDRRLKKNIKYVGTFKGRYLYLWEWIHGGTGFGVMADEVPDEFVEEINGLKVVDYGRLFGVE